MSWIDDSIVELMRQRDYHLNQFHKSNNSKSWENYKVIRNTVNRQIKNARNEFYKSQIMENANSPKQLWKCLKQLLPKNATTTTRQLNIDNSKTPEPKDIANAFNHHFTTVAEHLLHTQSMTSTARDNWKHTTFPVLNRPSFKIPPITENFINKELKTLKENKATGLDGLSAKILKISNPAIIHSLCYILNFSLQTSTFPTQWKTAKVCPLFKSGDRNKCDNYRPISILPILSKIIEHLWHIHHALYDYLNKFQLLDPCQSGFRPLHSCETAMNNTVDKWLQAIDNGQVNGVIFIDLCKSLW